jgi:Flp pilus assembly pilin Flp
MKSNRADLVKIATEFFEDCRGAAAIEYGLIAGLLSIAIAGVAVNVGEALVSNYYDKIIGALGGEGEED